LTPEEMKVKQIKELQQKLFEDYKKFQEKVKDKKKINMNYRTAVK
jgi:hypothetical protein